MDDRSFFELESDAAVTALQAEFLTALRRRLGDGVRPYCCEWSQRRLLLVLDIDAPSVALVTIGLELVGDELKGDRVEIQDRSFPPNPTPDGFLLQGRPSELAARGAELLDWYAKRPIVRHEWLYDGRVYAECFLFQDSGERLVQMYRSDWAPPGQEERLVADGFVHGKGWIQTRGLGGPDRVTVVHDGR